MAVDAFLDFSKATAPLNIKGETKDKKLPDTFHIKSFSFSVAQKGTAVTGGGMGAGKVEFEDFEFTIDTQKGSAELMKHCSKGSHFSQVWLHVRKAGGEQEVYLKYRFDNVLISSFSTSGEEESTDTVKFNFTSVFAEYFAQKEDGKLESTSSKGGWDLKGNSEVVA